jgi:hypothetical protein
MDRVRSTRYQTKKIAASVTANAEVLMYKLTPRPSVNRSVIWVPTTLTNTTVSQ